MGALSPWIETICAWLALFASLVVVLLIILHLRNYRKPFEQRFMVRIQLIVPLFAASCYSMLVNPSLGFNRFILEPTREIYEAFVIYTFFLLLTLMLGGERNIIIRTSGRQPVAHPPPLGWILPRIDILDPYSFLKIKQGIFQYVWLKPVICFGTLLAEGCGWYNVDDTLWKSPYLWLTLLYNLSVLLSLYCLALFWKILWSDLKPFNPVGKFLCVKLIIFALYWQGVMLAVFSAANLLPKPQLGSDNVGTAIQNALLCVELIFFAIGHWLSFLYLPFTVENIPNGRLKFWNAVKDAFGFADLVYDFQLTFHGDYYQDYRKFDSVEALIAHPESSGRMSRINQGLRYYADGKIKHWLPVNESQREEHLWSTSEAQALNVGDHIADSASTMSPGSISASGTTQGTIASQISGSGFDYAADDLDGDEVLYAEAILQISNYNIEQPQVKKVLNYPIVDEMINSHAYGHKIRQLRAERERNYGSI